MSALYAMDNVIVFPHLTCFEVHEGRPVLVKSDDPRLLSQKSGVRFGCWLARPSAGATPSDA